MIDMINEDDTKAKCPYCKRTFDYHTCYWRTCKSCPEGHSSFHKTVVESPQWRAWDEYAYNEKRMLYDLPEVEETGFISAKHFEDFIKFVIKKYNEKRTK